jgi:protein-histidine pros-kinase
MVVVRPAVKISAIASRVSMGEEDVPEYVKPGKDEIASLSASFNRMRRSLENAMKMLEE